VDGFTLTGKEQDHQCRTERTEPRVEGRIQVSPDQLLDGMKVKMTGWTLADGSVLAKEVHITRDNRPTFPFNPNRAFRIGAVIVATIASELQRANLFVLNDLGCLRRRAKPGKEAPGWDETPSALPVEREGMAFPFKRKRIPHENCQCLEAGIPSQLQNLG